MEGYEEFFELLKHLTIQHFIGEENCYSFLICTGSQLIQEKKDVSYEFLLVNMSWRVFDNLLGQPGKTELRDKGMK